MADLTFDAVICGGGCKALFLAMYLQRYGGMSVGIFERRHEIGGGMATEETAAPGFRGNEHANIVIPWYYVPIWRDFPEFWEYGGQMDQYLVSEGASFANNGKCLTIYSEKHDPTQERTAKEIARYSEKDAERWLKLWNAWKSDEMQGVALINMYSPLEETQTPEMQAIIMGGGAKILESGIMPDSMLMAASAIRASRELWESPELQYCMNRFAICGAWDVSDVSVGVFSIMASCMTPSLGFTRGGTHQMAHAAHQILVQDGAQFFTHCEVDKILIENGTATGIRLTDGSQVKARKIVVSAGMSPMQLVEMVGRDVMGPQICRRVDNLSGTNIGCLMWYSIALHEAPKYKSAAWNPDINECFWHGLAHDNNPDHIARECHYARLGLWPPHEDYNLQTGCHSLVDPSYAPPGKHVAHIEMQGPPANQHTEKEWLKIKRWYAEQMMEVWSKHAPNMTWDNVIGMDYNTPYDACRLKNLKPWGNFACIDRSLWQSMENRPCPELVNHRTPVKNLYATGGAWPAGSNASADAGYSCYKIIAKDLGLRKPGEEKGGELESLCQTQRDTVKRMRESFPRSFK